MTWILNYLHYIHNHGSRKGAEGNLIISYKMFSKNDCFLSFEWEKGNFTIFDFS